jgi:Ca2+-binding EF-hand superfamily protein
MHDYTQDLGYKCIDNQNIMYVDLKCFENFFRRLKQKGITDDDIVSIIRRLDLDSDGKLKKDELLKGIQA